MIELNQEIVSVTAAQYGLPRQFVVKEFQAFDVLEQIASSPSFAQRLVFKGGTALNKVYLGKMQRFSEDLDFDSGTESLRETLELSKELAESLKGYRIEEFRKVKATVQFYCEYDNPLGGKDNVRVDVAARKIITDQAPAVKPAVSLYAQRSVTGFRVYALEDLVARKLLALRSRTEGKDVYDAAVALPLCGSMEKPLEKALTSENSRIGVKEFIGGCVNAVEMADAKKMRNLTNPFIPLANRPPDWQELKNDLAMKLEALAN